MMLRILIVAALVPALSPAPPVHAQAPVRMLVVPFENSQSEPRFQWLSEASAVLLTDGLLQRGAGAIARRERVSAFEQLHLPIAASLSRATVIRVGQLLGVGEVIVGSFTVQDEIYMSAWDPAIHILASATWADAAFPRPCR